MKPVERLIKYVEYPTGSDPENADCPSNPKEWDFAKALAAEMEQLGFEDIELDDKCYLTGTIPANSGGGSQGGEDMAGVPVIGLIAHIDVSCEAPFENIKPQIIHYEGGDLIQDEAKDLRVPLEDYPFLENYKGCDIITSDGTTLLGGDNKAGIAEIMTIAERQKEFRHGKIRVCFTPDEEIGRSSDFFDVEKFGADFAYTVDGDAFGEVQSETFNAASATVHVKGFGIHPGSAKGMMKNANRMACEFDSMLPEDERPETTEGYEGFYHLVTMSGMVESATMNYILRDHDHGKLEKRAEFIQKMCDKMNAKYGEGAFSVEIEYAYRNMKEILDQYPDLVRIPLDVLREMGVEPDTAPIRGGTDGAFLSFKGLPCPNLGPGGHNFHSKQEFAVVQSMDNAVEMLEKILTRFASK